MKQTAVEYLVEELEKIGFSTNNIVEFENEVQIAKEIEKQQQGYSEEDIQSLIKIRNYFGENDKTFFEHFAYSFLDRIIEQFKNK
jgi:hypothetical protein